MTHKSCRAPRVQTLCYHGLRFGRAVAKPALRNRSIERRQMELATAIWTFLPLRSLAPVLIVALSVSGRAQQPNPVSRPAQAASKHTEIIEYTNRESGFRFTLPESWRGYRILWSDWSGPVLANNGHEEHSLQGPKLVIRHPKWTEENPREDMPIMIFTIPQWNQGPIVSAAPFGPSEIGRNCKYVFAVPPRWDYDFSEGYEEAEKLLGSSSLHTFSPAK
jgi:hypothetical protein